MSEVELKKRSLPDQIQFCIEHLRGQLAPPQDVIDGVILSLEVAQLRAEEIEAQNADYAQMFEFGVGAVVTLRSGGPKMTVQDIGTDVTCLWFDMNGALQMANDFKKESLQVSR